jgi:hypothetical protein
VARNLSLPVDISPLNQHTSPAVDGDSMELLPWQVLGRESRKGNLVGGDVRIMEGVEKGGLCGQEGDGESCLARKISHNNEMTMTSWFFQEECVPWYPRMTPTVKVSAFLDNLSSLRQEGSYCYKLKQWRRFYVTLEGIVINLVEDVPESGGQNCLWSAGAVMARYLECSDLRNVLCGQRILELGAGAGLTSMMAALLGGDVYSTEQKSCLGYLQVISFPSRLLCCPQRNIALNPDISIHTHELFWTLSCKENEQFDIILGTLFPFYVSGNYV